MTSRERVVKALTFSHPDRPPRDLWALPYISLFRRAELEAMHAEFPGDIGRPEISPGSGDAQLEKLARTGVYTDEWGSVWQVGEPGIIGEVKRPALADWSALATFKPPWHTLQERDRDPINRSCEASDKFMLSSVCATPFERLQFLRGTENLFLDLAYDTSEIRQLCEMVHDFYLADVEFWAASAVDAVFLMDDWGTNLSLLIDPRMWRAIFKPMYRDYCRIIHEAGKFAFFHSDGHIAAIVGDLIEVGMDAINSQLFCMDIEALGAAYRGKVTFWGEIDRQHVLPFGTPDEVRRAVERVHAALADPSGGVIAQCEWGKDNSAATIRDVFKTWNRIAKP